MMNAIIYDEIQIVYKKYYTNLSKKKSVATFLIISSHTNPVSHYYLTVFDTLIKKNPDIPIRVYFLDVTPESISLCHDYEFSHVYRLKSLDELGKTKNLITTFILDLKNDLPRQTQDTIYESLTKVLNIYRNKAKGRLIFSSIIPDLNIWNEPYTALAELELLEIMGEEDENSLAHFLWKCEQEIINSGLPNPRYCLRFDNVFGPGIPDTKYMTPQKYIDDMQIQESCPEIEDSCTCFSCTYIRDVLLLYLKFFDIAQSDNIYNATSYNIDSIDVPTAIYKQFPTKLYHLNIVRSNTAYSYRTLDTRKIRNINWKPSLSFREALYRTICDKADIEYEIDHINSKYRGSIYQIRKLEMEIMEEIDKICKDNNINYFLVGGSLLGAIRHQGFIPWDDDLDIGMLREDFEKFRKLCPDLLPDKYRYQSYQTEKDSHYIFDKIRLRETYFSTSFSKQFPIENGIFVDILVYDKTSSNPAIQKIHINMIRVWKRAINVRWVNKPRKKVYYRTTKILLPFMRLIPFRVYHYIYEKIITCFNKSNSDYYIDSVGMNIERGAFRKECILGNVQRVPFENMMLPIPPGYDQYLRHWYGNDYTDIPPISARNSGHNLVQIDLGKYL